MSDNIELSLKDYLIIYTLLSSGYSLIVSIKSLIKFFGKKKISENLFSQYYSSHNIDNNYFQYDKYVLFSGIAKKMFPKTQNNLIDSSIIISKSNSTYVESFYVIVDKIVSQKKSLIKWLIRYFRRVPQIDEKKYLVIPSHSTNYLCLINRWLNPIKMGETIFKKLFLTKSPSISDEDKVYILGKLIGKNQLHNTMQVKPYFISTDSFEDIEHDSSSVFPLFRNTIYICGCCLYIMTSLKHFYSKINSWIQIRKRRSNIICQFCNVKLCDTLCPHCENVTNYCNTCYSSLQDKIDKEELAISEVLCVHCGNVLESVHQLIV